VAKKKGISTVAVSGHRSRERSCARSRSPYTYTQPVREGVRYNLYHGTMEAVPVSAATSKLVYTLVFDNSMLADAAAREKDIQQRTAQFTRALNNMKTLAEGGTIPPAAARGPGR
jgi:hypothetical protein